MRTVRISIVVGFLVVAICVAASVNARPAQQLQQASATYSLNIPAQQLSASLRELGDQTHFDVIFDQAELKGHKAAALKGRYDMGQALARLLNGTDLIATFLGTSTVVIKQRRIQPSAPAATEGKQDSSLRTLGEIVVLGHAEALTATRANTPLKEIPQTVTLISQETLDEQNANDLAAALRYEPGFTIYEGNGSNQSTINSRGFTVDSVHIDGGAPIQLGGLGGEADASSLDMAQFNGVEVLRGSDALFGGSGNPGATVSMSRKMPTPFFQASVDTSLGSWNDYRVVGDAGGPLTNNLGGRLVVSGTSNDYFYDVGHKRAGMLYGVLKYQWGKSTSLAVGASYQRTHSINDFGGLPLYSDGALPPLPRSLALTTPWARGTTSFLQGFAIFTHTFNRHWKVHATATEQEEHIPSDVFVNFLGSIDPTTGLIPSPLTANENNVHDKQTTFSATVTGTYDWFGHTQQIMFGFDYTHEISTLNSITPNYTAPPYIDPFHYDPYSFPPPDLSAGNLQSISTFYNNSTQWGEYAALRIVPLDHLALTIGGRLSSIRANDVSNDIFMGFAVPTTVQAYSDSGKVTPYAGITYDLNSHLTAYASWADIYHTNSGLLDVHNKQLPPANGDTAELGLKGAWYGSLLNWSLALFRADQIGDAVIDPKDFNGFNCCYFSQSVKSKGIDTQITGMVTPHWTLTAGYTYDIHEDVSNIFANYPPRNMFKLWTNYQLPRSNWSIGGGIRAYSRIHISECEQYNADFTCAGKTTFGRGGYAVADLRASYWINGNWSVAVNVNNIFDRVYWQSLTVLEAGNWYGAPRSVTVKLSGTF